MEIKGFCVTRESSRTVDVRGIDEAFTFWGPSRRARLRRRELADTRRTIDDRRRTQHASDGGASLLRERPSRFAMTLVRTLRSFVAVSKRASGGGRRRLPVGTYLSGGWIPRSSPSSRPRSATPIDVFSIAFDERAL